MSQLDFKESTPLEFKVKDEPWLKFKLDDKSLLFGKLVVSKIYRSNSFDTMGQPIYGWGSQGVFTTISPRELKGTPAQIPHDAKGLDSTPIQFELLGQEKWNIYEVSDGTLIRIKLEITSVGKTALHVPDGDPFYIVNHQSVHRLKVPPSLLKKRKAPSDKSTGIYT